MISRELSNSVNITAAALAAQHAADANLMLADKSPEFRFGYEDGTVGAAFAPEVWFSGAYRQSSYTLGFLTAQPGNVIACDWWSQFVAADEQEHAIAMDNAAAVRHSIGAW